MSLAIDRNPTPHRKPRRPGYLRNGEWEAQLRCTAAAAGKRPEPLPVYDGPIRLRARLNQRRRREQERVNAV